MSTPVNVLVFVNFATVLNKYLGLCLFSSKRDANESYLAVLMLFCKIGYFPAKPHEIPLVLFSYSCAQFSGLFSLIILKRKGATVSKVLEKRESIVSVTSSSFSVLLDMLTNLDKSGRLLTNQSFVVEVMVLPYL